MVIFSYRNSIDMCIYQEILYHITDKNTIISLQYLWAQVQICNRVYAQSIRML